MDELRAALDGAETELRNLRLEHRRARDLAAQAKATAAEHPDSDSALTSAEAATAAVRDVAKRIDDVQEHQIGLLQRVAAKESGGFSTRSAARVPQAARLRAHRPEADHRRG